MYYVCMQYCTFPTHRHIQHAVVQAFLWRHTESLIFRVVLAAGQRVPGWREAVRWDALQLHLLLKAHVDGPAEDPSNIVLCSDDYMFNTHGAQQTLINLANVTLNITFDLRILKRACVRYKVFTVKEAFRNLLF